MDEFQRAHLDDGCFLGAHDGGTGDGGCAGADEEFSTTDHETLPWLFMRINSKDCASDEQWDLGDYRQACLV